ncbi:MAG TPA: SGNH/GDSL hydrolase family protein [Verrucomicrobiae bacterium]|nr:SGNH/GDSL hydrolase family protein [Verrucomicrobiae bacterium]
MKIFHFMLFPLTLLDRMKQQHSERNTLDRRGFLKTTGVALGIAGLTGLATETQAADFWPIHRSLVRKNNVVLFQGDSITDMGRSRDEAAKPNNGAAMGAGYAWFAGAELLVDRPKDNLKIFNRGISGNKVFQLAERWDADCLALKPDVLSILIGVNDFWHTLSGNYSGTVEIYERDYRALLTRTLKALPKVRLILCEPFVLRTGHVNEKWFPTFDQYRAAVRRVAQSFHATFVPFQAMFDEAVKYSPPEQWAKDGVHPTSAGASLMAHNWLKAANGRR